jgi:hypothetical protein
VDAAQRYAGRMAISVADPSDYVGTSAATRCDGPGAEIKLESPQIWSPPGSCCYQGGDCGNSNTSKTQNVRFVFPRDAAGPEYKYRIYLPEGLTCAQDDPCTLQWLFMTGNSQDSYPEAFRNCADFKLATGGSGIVPTSAPSASPEQEPEPEPAETSSPTAVGNCKGLCSRNTHGWMKKCAWDDCVGCSECGDLTPTLAPTSATTSSPTLAPPTPSTPNDGCVDVQGNSCSACLASNDVCYTQPKSWCDTFKYTWCGASLIQIRRSSGFLGLLQTAFSHALGSSSRDASVTNEL